MVLSACSRDPDEPEEIPEINSFNIFFTEEESSSGVKRGFINAFDFETNTATVVDTFTAGDSMAIALDTDEEKEGFEYAAYVKNGAVHLLDFDKEFGKQTEELREFTSTICGLHTSVIASQTAFDRQSDYYLTERDAPTVLVQVNNSACDRETDQYYKLSFNPDNFGRITESGFASSSEVIGTHFLAPNYINPANEDGEIERGTTLRLGFDSVGQTIRLSNEDGAILAEASLENTSITPKFTKVGSSYIVVQNDLDIYTIPQSDLIDIAATLSDTDAIAPNENLFALLFETSTLTLNSSTSTQVNIEHNGIDFIVDDSGILRLFRDNAFKELSDVTTLNSYLYALDTRGLTYLVSDYGTHKSLSTIANPGVGSPSILISIADDIEIKSTNRRMFINSINSEQFSGWRLTEISEDETRFVNNSAFVAAANLTENDSTIYILFSNDDEVSSNALINPALYAYDPDANDALGFFQDGNNEDLPESDSDDSKIEEKISKRYGFLNKNLSGFPLSIFGTNFQSNVEFAGITVFTTDESSPMRSYFFKPNFVDDPDNITEDNKLALLRLPASSKITKQANAATSSETAIKRSTEN